MSSYERTVDTRDNHLSLDGITDEPAPDAFSFRPRSTGDTR